MTLKIIEWLMEWLTCATERAPARDRPSPSWRGVTSPLRRACSVPAPPCHVVVSAYGIPSQSGGLGKIRIRMHWLGLPRGQGKHDRLWKQPRRGHDSTTNSEYGAGKYEHRVPRTSTQYSVPALHRVLRAPYSVFRTSTAYSHAVTRRAIACLTRAQHSSQLPLQETLLRACLHASHMQHARPPFSCL